jgi:hypothetical protein
VLVNMPFSAARACGEGLKKARCEVALVSGAREHDLRS